MLFNLKILILPHIYFQPHPKNFILYACWVYPKEKIVFPEDKRDFDYNEVLELKNRLRSNNVGDAAAKVWALIVFQWWWKRNMNL